MRCKYIKTLYENPETQYRVCLYEPADMIISKSHEIISTIKAVGYALPIAPRTLFDLHGKWNRTNYGIQFECYTYDQYIEPTKEGIIAYLSSGQIKGIGKKTAENIYKAFGDNTLQILDSTPERLKEVKGISDRKLKSIVNSYIQNRGAKDIIVFLTPYGISPKLCVKLYKKYGANTIKIVKEHPYKICEMKGISFKTADKVATSIGYSPTSPERIAAALLFCLEEAEKSGSMCISKEFFIENTIAILNTPEITVNMVKSMANKLYANGKIAIYDNAVFSFRADRCEDSLARLIHKKISEKTKYEYTDLDGDVQQEEANANIKFHINQKLAIKTALTSNFSVITGGAGMGKTSLLKALLNIYKAKNPDKSILCCSPTGRAARRMTESTGYPALTIHKALMLGVDEIENNRIDFELAADLIVVDEVSMLDTYIAQLLFTAVKEGCQVVFIGDSAQLPSVGAGTVLCDIITSGVVPTVHLTKVFRQKGGSRVFVNAQLVRYGDSRLEYGDDFIFVKSPIEESAKKICDTYLQEVAKYGIDNVMLLSPFRQRTETGVNALNTLLQAAINPAARNKAELVTKSKTYRVGDKVMQIKNNKVANNGDIGYIKAITNDDGEKIVVIDFGDERTAEYTADGINEYVDLGYACTVHKSQGSEAKSVIINLQMAHYIMLNRQIIYTAISRSSEKVTIIGDYKAFCIGISKIETEQRGTRLTQRLESLFNK